jgi:outer membrane protein assembly factor BamD
MKAVSLRFAVLALMAALAACGGRNKKEQLAYIERPAETIYQEAVDKLDKKRMTEAALLFDEVERQHPYSEWARRAMMMAAYTKYIGNDYEGAIANAERYVALYPSGETTAYAYYLIALCYYERILDVGRDQRTTEQALASLQQVTRRFPETDYARDARLKIEMTRDHLAGKEMEVGRWYLRQGHYTAAINRFKRVIEEYETTTHTPEALHRLVEAYVALGIMEEAEQVAAVLGYNYPGSNWYSDSYNLLAREGVVDASTGARLEAPEKRKRSWWGRTVGRFF